MSTEKIRGEARELLRRGLECGIFDDAPVFKQDAADIVSAGELSELEEIRRGELIAETLQVKKDKEGRYKTEWGTKTPLGLFRTVKRLIEEGQ